MAWRRSVPLSAPWRGMTSARSEPFLTVRCSSPSRPPPKSLEEQPFSGRGRPEPVRSPWAQSTWLSLCSGCRPSSSILSSTTALATSSNNSHSSPGPWSSTRAPVESPRLERHDWRRSGTTRSLFVLPPSGWSNSSISLRQPRSFRNGFRRVKCSGRSRPQPRLVLPLSPSSRGLWPSSRLDWRRRCSWVSGYWSGCRCSLPIRIVS